MGVFNFDDPCFVSDLRKNDFKWKHLIFGVAQIHFYHFSEQSNVNMEYSSNPGVTQQVINFQIKK